VRQRNGQSERHTDPSAAWSSNLQEERERDGVNEREGERERYGRE
jgi:hypothetical protein